MNRPNQQPDNELLSPGARVAFVGRLASTSHQDAAQLIAEHGAISVSQDDPLVSIVVLGESGVPLGSVAAQASSGGLLREELLQAAQDSQVRIISESDFWQQLGVDSPEADVRLFTPGMLAELLKVPVAVIRRWQRRGLIRPVKAVRRLAYFDFQEVSAARQLAALVDQGVSPAKIERQLALLARFVPGIHRPLAQLGILVEGRNLLLRAGSGLVDSSGQRRFDFETRPAEAEPAALGIAPTDAAGEPPSGSLVDQLVAEAERLEDDGELSAAAEAYRAALAAAGPNAEINFALAELLYRQGEVAAARERYYSALELDEDYVEARANLGCVLLELGDRELAIAAFCGALASHPEYPDAHFHLARTLDELNRPAEAEQHWHEFLRQAPESPWADEARQRLATTLQRQQG